MFLVLVAELPALGPIGSLAFATHSSPQEECLVVAQQLLTKPYFAGELALCITQWHYLRWQVLWKRTS